MIVQRDENGQAEQEHCQTEGEQARARVRECRVAHQTGGVNHGELVDELHRVFEGGVEEEAAGADEQVADVADEEDGVVAVFSAGGDAPVGEVDEEEVRECINYFSRVGCCVVVLQSVSRASEIQKFICTLLHTSSALR